MALIIDFLFFLADPDGLRTYCIDDKLTGSQGCIRKKKKRKERVFLPPCICMTLWHNTFTLSSALRKILCMEVSME